VAAEPASAGLRLIHRWYHDAIRARRANHFLAIVGLAMVAYPHCSYRPHGRRLERKLKEAIMKKQITLAIVVGMAVIATPVSFNAPREDQAIVTLNSAEAKVGQPLSATSVAGVNRRQGRREKRKTN
jgi:hypothetical protein